MIKAYSRKEEAEVHLPELEGKAKQREMPGWLVPSCWWSGLGFSGCHLWSGLVRVSSEPGLGLTQVVGTQLPWLWVESWRGGREPRCAVVGKFTTCPEAPVLVKLPGDKPRSLGRVCSFSLVLSLLYKVKKKNSSPQFLNL